MSTPSFLLGHLIDAVRVNAVAQAERAGKLVWIKRRRVGMDGVIVAGNQFLRLSNSRIRMFPNAQEWLAWELHCFELLHGDQVQCGYECDRGFWVEALPGQSLLQLLARGDLSLPMLRAAARELRRAHSLFCPQLQVHWSHGDPHLANVLYDAHGDRAYLIDFETQHQRSLSPLDRQADDLLVFVLDLLGRLPQPAWLPYTMAFLNAYGQPSVLQHMQQRLYLPQGFERVLWATRTNYLSSSQLKHRLDELKQRL